MARETTWKCDLCGEYAAEDTLAVIRVGDTSDRPEDCDRVDVGPCCQDKPMSAVIHYVSNIRSGI